MLLLPPCVSLLEGLRPTLPAQRGEPVTLGGCGRSCKASARTPTRATFRMGRPDRHLEAMSVRPRTPPREHLDLVQMPCARAVSVSVSATHTGHSCVCLVHTEFLMLGVRWPIFLGLESDSYHNYMHIIITHMHI